MMTSRTKFVGKVRLAFNSALNCFNSDALGRLPKSNKYATSSKPYRFCETKPSTSSLISIPR